MYRRTSAKMPRPSTKSAALAYLARGWSVIPIGPRSKRPLVRWAQYQRRLATAKEINAWYRRWRNANVGIVTGRISGLIVLDVDPRHFGDDTLFDMERAYGPLPHTVESITGSGGRHIYFAYPGRVTRNVDGLATGLDLKGDGGVVVAPPSVHPSGRRYEWEVSHHPDSTPLSPLPRWIHKLIWTTSVPKGHTVDHWRSLVRGGVPEGQRNNSVAITSSSPSVRCWH